MRRPIRETNRVLAVVCTAMWTASAWAADAPPTAEQLQFFEKKVRPVLVESCYRCHGSEKQKGKLRLDSRAAMLAGGGSGPAVVPGNPEESLLIQALAHVDDSLKMPPDKKLPDAQIADLTAWVKSGAAFPGDANVTAPTARERVHSNFWSFQPPSNPAPPDVQRGDWSKSPLDRFILAELEAHGLHPAPPADKRTLLRRATFDLTGLPPTPEEVAAFLADDTPEAFARVVERLLESPHYGERWGRHWLDVVRYSDSNGLDENVAHGNAWRYRDYVVQAFNRDKPYDRFLIEQLAGDLLPAENTAQRHEQLIATGYLALGPKVLAEVDEKKMEMDIVDEQIDTFGKSILGLTLGCARCHDHKFDPIGTDDYYALAGIFKSTRTMENFTKVAKWWENDIASAEELGQKARHAERIAQQKTMIDHAVQQANEKLKAAAPGGELPQDAEAKYPEETKTELKRLRDELAMLEKNAPVMSSAMGVTESKPTDVAIHVRGSHLTLGRVVPRGFPQVLTSNDAPITGDHSGRLELAQWLVRREHPLTSRVMVNRLWRWHFGRGLCGSTDNFGRLGDQPSHPALLDWLAQRFVDEGWSIKQMHRIMMLSSTYQMSSFLDSKCAELDPDNRWHWRAEIRRLEAEEIRDALLAVSGTLDPAMGGPVLHVANRGYLFDHTSKDLTKYDSRRRSLYLPVIRNNLYDVFQLFDAPDASVLNGDRASTTVAPQALFMLNSDLMAQACEALADGLLASPGDTAQRVDRLYLAAYGRPATPEEINRLQVLLTRFTQAADANKDETQRSRQAWSWLAQVVLAANEFVYLR
ncbi:MAG TPA: PSD1 and planctomycete cytochrome C domain-containing protein [Planctomycetaceae bacterium]|nr:PSD1 and planctomycete cytochrome C domain-containing protein [Planctomycetaceae bacterium]